jgi:PAS domain-containing protein
VVGLIPDGAIAFLFEDISSEVSLTRLFRAQLDVLQSVVDRVPQALAVFSPSGVMTFANTAYQELWECDPDSSFGDLTFDDAKSSWRAMCDRSDGLAAIQPHSTAHTELRLVSGRKVTCQVQMVAGGGFAVFFQQMTGATIVPALEGIA